MLKPGYQRQYAKTVIEIYGIFINIWDKAGNKPQTSVNFRILLVSQYNLANVSVLEKLSAEYFVH